MDDRPLLSIVCPFFNEADNVVFFYEALARELDALPAYRFEVICIDDGSRDDTLQALLDLVRKDSRIQVVELTRNFGKEAALSAGLDVVSGDAVITIDADLQDPLTLVAQLIDAWRSSQADVVLARRRHRRHDTPTKRATAKAYYAVHNLLSDVKLTSNVGDCRLMTRQVVDAVSQLPETQRFMKGLFAWVGFKAVVVDYDRQPRQAGKSKFSWWRLWNFGIEGITSFSTIPLRVWTYVGLTGALFAFVFGLYVVLRTLILGTDVPGYASLLVAVLFFGSVQLIGLGILGEYVGRMYMESKRRPAYLIRQRHGTLNPNKGGESD